MRVCVLLAVIVGGISCIVAARTDRVAHGSASTRADPSLVVRVDDSKEDTACGVAETLRAGAASFPVTITNRNSVAVSLTVSKVGDSDYTIRDEPPWLSAYGVLFGHSLVNLRGAFFRAGDQLVISCDAGDGKAALVNVVLRPLVDALAPASLDDLNAILELKRSYDWGPIERWSLSQLRDHIGTIIKMVYGWSKTRDGEKWIAKHAARINLAVKLTFWSADLSKTLGNYLTFALVHGQRSIVTFSAAMSTPSATTIPAEGSPTPSLSSSGVRIDLLDMTGSYPDQECCAPTIPCDALSGHAVTAIDLGTIPRAPLGHWTTVYGLRIEYHRDTSASLGYRITLDRSTPPYFFTSYGGSSGFTAFQDGSEDICRTLSFEAYGGTQYQPGTQATGTLIITSVDPNTNATNVVATIPISAIFGQ